MGYILGFEDNTTAISVDTKEDHVFFTYWKEFFFFCKL